MSFPSSKANNFRKLSVWIIAVFVITNILAYLSIEYLVDSVHYWIYSSIIFLLGLLLIGDLIMSLAISIQIIRKTDYRKHFTWLVVSATPFVFFLLSTILALS